MESLDLPMDYDSLREAGSIIGSGGLIVMDEESCMVDLARFYLDFNQDESCGKCTPAGSGASGCWSFYKRSLKGGEEQDLEILEQLALLMKNGSLCALGRTAPILCSAPCASFATSTWPTLRSAAAPPGSAAAWCDRGSTRALQSLRPLRPGLPGGGDQR